MEFSRQEYWSGEPFPSPADLPDPGIELVSPSLQVDSLPPSYQGSPGKHWRVLKKLKIELPYNPTIPLLDTCLEKTKKIHAPQCSPQPVHSCPDTEAI